MFHRNCGVAATSRSHVRSGTKHNGLGEQTGAGRILKSGPSNEITASRTDR